MSKIIFHADDFGRSPNISQKLYMLIKNKKITSISIIVSEKIYGLSLIKKSNVSKRLHLNLTDFSIKKTRQDYIYNFSFFKLLILPILPGFKINKKKIEKEIIRQIKIYKKKINQKSIFLDGHQHVHMIPWIFNLIFNLRKKYNIKNIRIPDEPFILNFSEILNLNLIINLIKYFLLKFLIILSKKKISKVNYKFNFFGIIYSGIYNKKYLSKIIKIIDKNKSKNKTEILVHPSFALSKERNLFKKNFFKYYKSFHRKKEYKLINTYNF